MPFIIAHEFFDALPIHAFQAVSSTSPASSTTPPPEGTLKQSTQWREMVVSPTPPNSTHESLRTPMAERHDTPVPDFQLTLSKTSTRHSLHVPNSSARFRALLKSTPDALIEVSPDAALYASDFAARIGGSAQYPKKHPSGAALILDYGPGDGTVPANTLRGIAKHKRVSPFTLAGQVDLSADVDFGAIAEAAMRASEGVEVHGPVQQAAFLEEMGGRERAEVLAKAAGDKNVNVQKAWGRLVDRGPNGMGKVYKAMAIVPENDGRRRPVGFGGDVVQ
jgi:NADH dehydrogenase [ubiquinone] 1 alpha subcomplex assembly factor 7